MSPQLVSIQARVLAANARIEGMVAANQQRIAEGGSVAWTQDHFETEAHHMEILANQAIQESH